MVCADEQIAAVYANDMRQHQARRVAGLRHGFNVHYGQVCRATIWTCGWSPQGAGHTCATPIRRGAVAALIAVHADKSGKAATWRCRTRWPWGRQAGIIETKFAKRRDDLFGEQAVLCGGTVELIKAGFETLVEAGYAPEMAYFECLHELKLIVD